MTTTTPDLLELYKAREFGKIEFFLNSTEYTRAEKIAMITNKKDLFSKLCIHVRLYRDPIPIGLSIKVLRIFGENLGNYVDELKNIVTMNRHVEIKEKLLRVIVEELSEFQFTDVLTSLLVYSFEKKDDFLASKLIKQNILKTKKSIKYKYDITLKRTNEIELCSDDNNAANTDYVFYKDASLLEIALQNHVDFQIIKKMVRAGGKDPLLLSERSLIEGAILE